MPELPEVETMRQGVLPIVGSRIESASRPPCLRKSISFSPRIDAFDRRVRGKRVAGVDRCGKRVLIRIDNQQTDNHQTIVIEPRMTGLVLLADPPTAEHLRFRLTLSGGPSDQLLFWDRRGLGTIRLLYDRELEQIVNCKLGPDALEITAEQLRDSLGNSSRAIKVALMDQKVVAGVGNLYAAEILFVAGVDPRSRCDRLSKPQWQRIEKAMQAVLCEAIRFEGSTLGDGTYRNALNGEGGYQAHHRVYARAGLRCPRCAQADIQRLVQAGRSTFFCPICQRKRGLHASIGLS